MNFNHLLIFQKVAEKEHFTRAAEELFISQPAVSKQIQELEREVGQALFEQVGRKVHLTEAGKLLYEYANRIFALATEAEIALDELQGLQRGHLAVGASMTIGTYLLPELLGQFKALYPAITLFLDIANAEEVLAKVLANQVEVGLVEGFVTAPKLVKKAWQQDEMILIDAAQSPLIKGDRLSLNQVIDGQIPFILREQGSGTRAVLEKALEERSLETFKPILELNSLEAIKRAVTVGLGVSFVSKHSVKHEIEVGMLRRVELTDFELTRTLYLVYIRGKKLSKASQAFIDLITK